MKPPKQKPTMTPKQQFEAGREPQGLQSPLGTAPSLRKIGRAAMPRPERNDLSVGDGSRRKTPMRYD